MANTTFNTRLMLKYDTLANWTTNDPVLLKGEVAIVDAGVASGNINQVPAVLIKVGDGVKKFSELGYTSAIAGDVYSWAKAANKPEYAASEIKNLQTFVEEHAATEDTDTQYQVVLSEDGMGFKLQSKAKEATSWTDVQELKFSDKFVKSITTGSANGTISVDGNDVAVKGLASAAYVTVDSLNTTAQEKADAAASAVRGETTETVASVDAKVATANGKISAIETKNGEQDTAIANAASAAKAAQDAADAAQEAAEAAQGAADDKVASVTAADKSVTIGGTATAPTVKVALSASEDNALTLEADGLKVVVPDVAHPEYTIEKAADSGEYAAIYNLKKDGAVVGASINIPKDMVVKSGSVVTNPAGQPAGTYIEILFQNQDTPVYINVANLIEYVTSGSAAGDMVVVSVSDDHKVTATITDGTVTKAKLASDVTGSLAKADSAVQKITVLGKELTNGGTLSASDAQTALGLGTAAYEAKTAFATAAQGALADSALQKADIITGTANGTISVDGSDVAVAGLKDAAYTTVADLNATAQGYATTAKNTVIGNAEDASTADTIKGAKKYADEKASAAQAAAKTYADETFVAAEAGKRLMTDAEGTKLAGIAAGAQANVIETIKVNGVALPVTDKAVDISHNIADLEQDVNTYVIFDCGDSSKNI